jgi:hypothetical protein
LAISQFFWPIVKKKNSQKIEDSMERWSASPFGPTIYMKRGGLWAKHMGLKQGIIENTLGEHIGSIRNILKS